MLKRLRRAHPVGYCLLTEVVFLAVLMVVPVLLVLLLVLLGVDLTRVDDCAVGSAPRSGRGGRGFKSRCSD